MACDSIVLVSQFLGEYFYPFLLTHCGEVEGV